MGNEKTSSGTRDSIEFLKIQEFCSNLLFYLGIIAPDIQVECGESPGSNGTMQHVLCMQKAGVKWVPAIVLAPYYNSYQQGRTFGEIAKEILTEYEAAMKFGVTELSNYETVKGQLGFKLVNLVKNLDMLADVPYVVFFDLAIVPMLYIHSSANSSTTCIVRYHLLNEWGITKEQLMCDALRQAAKNQPAVLRPMDDVLMDFTPVHGVCTEIPMFVLSNQSLMNGAGSLLYAGMIDACAQRIGGGFYILPSSVHEVLLVPEQLEPDLVELIHLVQYVNEAEVKPEEVLSDQVYHYNPDTNIMRQWGIRRNAEGKEEAVVKESFTYKLQNCR